MMLPGNTLAVSPVIIQVIRTLATDRIHYELKLPFIEMNYTDLAAKLRYYRHITLCYTI